MARSRAAVSAKLDPPASPAELSVDAPRGSIYPLLLLGAVLFSVPFFVRIEVEQGAKSRLAQTIPVADLMLWFVAAVVLAVSAWRGARRGSARAASPNAPGLLESIRSGLPGRGFRIPWLLWGFVALGATSTLLSSFGADGLVELVQCFDYYVLWYGLAALLIARAPARAWGYLLTGLLVLLALAAGWQIWHGAPAGLVRSLFRDQASFAMSWLLLAPLVWLLPVGSGRAAHWLGSIVAGGGALLLGSALAIGLALAQLVVAARLIGGTRQRYLGPALAPALLLFFAVPAGYRAQLLRQPLELVSVNMGTRRLEVFAAKASLEPSAPRLHLGLGAWHVFGGTSALQWLRTGPRAAPAAEPAALRVPPEYFAESWSALALIAQDGALGRGLGSWRKQIGTGYGVLERTGTLFPNTSNGYLHVGLATGLAGLLLWCAAGWRALRRARRRMVTRPGSIASAWAVGCLGGLSGAALFMLVCPFVTQPPAIFWTFLVASLHARPPDSAS